MTEQKQTPWGQRAKDAAEAAKGSNFTFLGLETDGSVQAIIPGSIVSRENRRFGGMRNQTRIIVILGTYYAKDQDGEPVAREVSTPHCLMLGMSKTLTKQYKDVMAGWDGAGLPILTLKANPKRKGFEPGVILEVNGERIADEAITELVSQTEWIDANDDGADVPF